MPAVPRALVRAAVPLLVGSLVLAGCSSESDEEPTAADQAGSDGENRVVSTEQGDVTIPANPEDIVVLNSALAGYFYALEVPVHGAIPLNTDATEWPEFWSDEAESDGTTMIPWSNDGFDFEALLAEDPDLIVAGGQGFPGQQAIDTYDQLTDIAPTVIVSSELSSWQEELDVIANDILNKPDEAQALLDEYDARVAEVRESIEPPPTPASYLLMLPDMTPWSVPETASLATTLGDVGIEPAPVIADNPDFELFGSGDSFEVATEHVGRTLTYPSLFVLGFQADVTSVAELSENEVYSGLPAFDSGHAYDLPYWAHRADYYATMALLDHIDEMFG